MFVRTYFIWEEGIERYSFEVVSLTTDPDNLFKGDTGIYTVGTKYLNASSPYPDGGTPANYNQRGREWEREANIEFFNTAGEVFLNQGIGIRTFGGWSRANAKKSFKLFPRRVYDEAGSLDYPFFDGLMDEMGRPIESFERLLLRSGGNDWDHTLFRDPLVVSLVEDICMTQAYKPVILFLNGEYFGIYHLREHMDQNYLASHFNLDSDKTSIFNMTGSGPELYEGEEEELERYWDFFGFLEESDLSIESEFEQVEEMIDLEILIN